ncbi:MAG TPA: hypothetical protein VGD50_05385 [Candidatus Baltobacteraceae bacterium]
MRLLLSTAGLVSIIAMTTVAAAAQSTQTTQTTQTTTDTSGPHSPYCGDWANGTWTPNGNCVTETTTTVTSTDGTAPADTSGRTPERVNGTITFVKGHLVTLQQSTQSLVIDDSAALDSHETGRVAVGRAVVAHGYWDGGTFYATRLK